MRWRSELCDGEEEGERGREANAVEEECADGGLSARSTGSCQRDDADEDDWPSDEQGIPEISGVARLVADERRDHCAWVKKARSLVFCK